MAEMQEKDLKSTASVACTKVVYRSELITVSHWPVAVRVHSEWLLYLWAIDSLTGEGNDQDVRLKTIRPGFAPKFKHQGSAFFLMIRNKDETALYSAFTIP